MTVQTVRFDVARLLADTNEHVRECEAVLASGYGRDRVNAAGELVALRKQKQLLEQRLDELDHCHDSALDTLVQRIKEEAVVLRHSLEAWVTH
jgi:hypothetical protein